MTRTTTEHTIVIQSAMPSGPVRHEAVGTGEIWPGMLIEFESNGYLQLHSTAVGASAKLVAVENQTPDTNSYPTTAANLIPYASGDTVYFVKAGAGDVLNMRLKTSESTVKGQTFMASDGAGHVQALGTGISIGTSNPVGQAWETVSTGGSAGFVRVMF